MLTIIERLNALAGELDRLSWVGADGEELDRPNKSLSECAYALSELANEVGEHYVRADADGEVPTNAQAIALARFLRPAFNVKDRGYRFARISRGGAGLPEDYLHVVLADGYEGGIDRDGRTST